MKSLFVIGLVFAATLFVNPGSAHAANARAWHTSCVGRFNLKYGWMLEGTGGDICTFKPADVAAILRICGRNRCAVRGIAHGIPEVHYPGRIESEFGDLLLTDITSIRLAKPDETAGTIDIEDGDAIAPGSTPRKGEHD